jgi:hypothetical protein
VHVRRPVRPDVGRKTYMNPKYFLCVILPLLFFIAISCNRAPNPESIVEKIDKDPMGLINDYLDRSPDYIGPKYLRIQLSKVDGTISYEMNNEAVSQLDVEATLARLPATVPSQIIVLEFKDDAGPSDLVIFPNISQFNLIGRRWNDPKSIGFIGTVLVENE